MEVVEAKVRTGRSYENADVSVKVGLLLTVIRIGRLGPTPPGKIHVIDVSEYDAYDVHSVLLIRTLPADPNDVPVSVTESPPEAAPCVGVIDLIIGALNENIADDDLADV